MIIVFQKSYFWRWWRITGGKECADRFWAGWTNFYKETFKTVGTSKPTVFFCFKKLSWWMP